MGWFTWFLGKPMTPAQVVRKQQRAITKAMRDLDRERMRMEQQEKKLIADIKKSATAGQMDVCKIIATDLVRTRQYIKKFMLMKANLQAVSVKILTLQSQQSIAEAMRGVTMSLRGMNQRMRLPQVKRILMEFEKQSQIMDLKEEIINDAIDTTVGEEDQEAESDELVTQVLDELGLQLQQQLPELPGGRKSARIAEKAEADDTNNPDFDDLQTRLNNLRRD